MTKKISKAKQRAYKIKRRIKARYDKEVKPFSWVFDGIRVAVGSRGEVALHVPQGMGGDRVYQWHSTRYNKLRAFIQSVRG